ncbi:2-phosphosulfolactate phosphatase [Kibdelosporangium philippinense]|uniref:Probable 2-phosphosulfolactate phosphatase n=1 Tax=Kibdelosporangium philippinense TaxID=211113 RepID=A0ABS8ZM23_9PSEU|nr:2-phosphosulfolactate phosphatase [Kibdelosporangium philippinense]MCE7007503.1 2-phosphosulfolactate phosphatase [Kibdelosporangium philippinense]
MFTQDGFGVRMEWGMAGVEALAPHCTVLIIVDVLSFTTSVDLAVSQGARVVVKAPDEQSTGLKRPSELKSVQAGTELTFTSPNGGRLSEFAAQRTRVMAGCLRNAAAVADRAIDLADRGPIGVIPAGEQWGVNFYERQKSGAMRVAMEDYLGAGAIVSALLAEGYSPASPEAAFAATSYRTAEPYLAELLGGCGSGLELGEKGLSEDIALAGQVNVSKATPTLVNGVFQ